MLGLRKQFFNQGSTGFPVNGLYVDAQTMGNDSAIYNPGSPDQAIAGQQDLYSIPNNSGWAFWTRLSNLGDQIEIRSDTAEVAGGTNTTGRIILTMIVTAGTPGELQWGMALAGGAGVPTHGIQGNWTTNIGVGWNHVAFKIGVRSLPFSDSQVTAYLNGQALTTENVGGIPQTVYAYADDIRFNRTSFVIPTEPQRGCVQQFIHTRNFDINEIAPNGEYVDLGDGSVGANGGALTNQIYEVFDFPFTTLQEPNATLTLTQNTIDHDCSRR